jgi:hypothetical protein
LLSFAVLALLNALSSAAYSQSDTAAPAATKISTDYYVAWWMHDATGYHPAIYMILQNTSAADLSFKPIKFQGLFRDLKNGYVTVARDEIRREFRPNQQILLLLEGPKAFELPIDKNAWPVIECKVMCRVASIDDDSATQDIVVTKLAQEAMTEEEATSRIQDYSHPHMIKAQSRREHDHVAPAKPMMATALPLNSSAPHARGAGGAEHAHDGLSHLLSSSRSAGLGDDFYDFEQLFGKPIDFTYIHDTKWTWARYSAGAAPTLSFFAGSRGHSSKVDYIVAVVPSESVQDDAQLLSLGKVLAGKLKSQPLSTPSKTVKYLSTGRIQLTNASAPSYKLFVIAPRGAGAEDNNYILGVSRLPGDPRLVLADNARHTPMLRAMSPVLSDQEPD